MDNYYYWFIDLGQIEKNHAGMEYESVELCASVVSYQIHVICSLAWYLYCTTYTMQKITTKPFFFFTELLGLKKKKKDKKKTKKNGDPSGKLCDSIHSQAVDKVLSSCH